MSKYHDYEELGIYLLSQDKALIPMTFPEIEEVIGRALPKSAKYPAWWSNNPSNNAMTQVWLKAGFKTEQVDTEGRKLVFRKVSQKPSASVPDHPAEGLSDAGTPFRGVPGQSAGAPAVCRHPLYGALKGYIRIAPDIDLTAPADPNWGERIWGDDGT